MPVPRQARYLTHDFRGPAVARGVKVLPLQADSLIG
jgi:hypothetical protein